MERVKQLMFKQKDKQDRGEKDMDIEPKTLKKVKRTEILDDIKN